MKKKILINLMILAMATFVLSNVYADDPPAEFKHTDEVGSEEGEGNGAGEPSNRNDGFHRKSHFSSCYVRDYYTKKWKTYTSTECYTWTVVLCMFTECIGQTEFPTDFDE